MKRGHQTAKLLELQLQAQGQAMKRRHQMVKLQELLLQVQMQQQTPAPKRGHQMAKLKEVLLQKRLALALLPRAWAPARTATQLLEPTLPPAPMLPPVVQQQEP